MSESAELEYVANAILELSNGTRDAGRYISQALCGDNRTLADALMSVAINLKYLGNGDAATQMGAIEALGVHIGEKIDGMSTAISELADAVHDLGDKFEDKS
jgi:hypothetical protein